MALIGYSFIRNMFKYDYPLEEAVFSLLPAVDRYLLCECYSDDGTYAEVMRWARREPKICLFRHKWGDHYTIQGTLANYLLDHVAEGDWCFKLDADEVMHEGSWELFRSLPDLLQGKGAVGARFHYTHFMGNYQTEFDFIYRRVRRFVQQGHNWQWVGDACDLADGNGEFVDVDVEIFHYGKVHETKVGLRKEQDFQAMYTDIGFPDPKLKIMEEAIGGVDYHYLFERAVREGEVRHFTGTHPEIMAKRIAEAKEAGWEQFERMMPSG